MESSERWSEGVKMFEAVLAVRDLEDEVDREARSERAWCMVGEGRFDDALSQLRAIVDELEQKADELKSKKDAVRPLGKERAKAWWRYGRCMWEMGGALSRRHNFVLW